MSFTKYEHDLRRYSRAGLTSPTDIIVYLTIKGYYNEDYGYAFPTVKTIAYDSGVSDKTVERSITRLKTVGLLNVKKTPQDNKVNNIYVPLEPIADEGRFNARFNGAEDDAKKRLETIAARRNKPTKSEREAPQISASKPPEPPDVPIILVEASAPKTPLKPAITVTRTEPPVDGFYPEMVTEADDDECVPIIDDGTDPYENIKDWF
ncbi:helix-turn-helix domain-containing protein [Paenibacillus solisilvae]|uniref:Helix-turn-helix domain-containing protein n=1 Tax=Paenibacillus solisilvae TaxID=2486751 RepID=A0ABW0VZ46_9BACL